MVNKCITIPCCDDIGLCNHLLHSLPHREANLLHQFRLQLADAYIDQVRKETHMIHTWYLFCILYVLDRAKHVCIYTNSVRNIVATYADGAAAAAPPALSGPAAISRMHAFDDYIVLFRIAVPHNSHQSRTYICTACGSAKSITISVAASSWAETKSIYTYTRIYWTTHRVY